MNKRTEKGYINSYSFAKNLTSKKKYLKYWNNHQAQFILTDINESNHSFSVIIDFDNSHKDLFNKYSVLKEDDYHWYIKDRIQQKLNNFDNWKINKNEKLNYSNRKEIKGILYKNKPTIKSDISRKKAQIYHTFAYVETEEGKFYLTKYSLNKLSEDRPKFCNWIHEIK